jgi:phosphate acyltransferase
LPVRERCTKQGIIMRIVLDAMGSDECPVPDVEGAVLASREFGDTIILVGGQEQIKGELQKYNTSGLNLEVVPAQEVISMTDKPSVVGKGKPQSSMHIGLKLVADKEADAFVTAGNTGAALTIATLFTLRRIGGVKRPALGSIIRVLDAKPIILLDIGATPDAKPDWLLQFALMGQIYAQKALGIANPRVALLSNGEEEGKGNQLIHETSDLLRASSLNFMGNIEPKDMVRGAADVIVADGFVGNIAVKTLEAMGSALSNLIRQEIRRDLISTVGGLLARQAFRRVAQQVDPFEIGGAPLLGVNGVVIIGHGRSNAKAIKNAIRQARLAVDGQVIQAIQEGLKNVSGQGTQSG